MIKRLKGRKIMNYLLITCHPYDGSFNASVATALKQTICEKGHNVSEIDLIEDGFNPVMTSPDLRAWGKGQSVDPLVPKYQSEIEKADVLVFPFPIWWGAMPAVLKGFCDKVLLPGWAYKYGEHGELVGLQTSKKAIVITTMETPCEVFEEFFNNPVEGAFIKDTLQTCGMEVLNYMQIDKIVSGGQEYTETKIAEIKKLVK